MLQKELLKAGVKIVNSAIHISNLDKAIPVIQKHLASAKLSREERERMAEKIFPGSEERIAKISEIVESDAWSRRVSDITDGEGDGDEKEGQDFELPHYYDDWEDMEKRADDMPSSLEGLLKIIPGLGDFVFKNLLLSYGEGYHHSGSNAPDDAIVIIYEGNQGEEEIEFGIEELAAILKVKKADLNKFKKWLFFEDSEGVSGIHFDGEYVRCYEPIDTIIAIYIKLPKLLKFITPKLKDLAPEDKEAAEDLLEELKGDVG